MEKLPTPIIEPNPELKVRRLEELVLNLWAAVQDLQESFIVQQKVAPDKPREGMIRYADGVNWNPGAGSGLYQYISGVWEKLNN